MTISASPGIELRYIAADQKLAFIVYYDVETQFAMQTAAGHERPCCRVLERLIVRRES